MVMEFCKLQNMNIITCIYEREKWQGQSGFVDKKKDKKNIYMILYKLSISTQISI